MIDYVYIALIIYVPLRVGERVMTDDGVVQVVRIREEKCLGGREEVAELHLWWRRWAWFGGGGAGEDEVEGQSWVRLTSIHVMKITLG